LDRLCDNLLKNIADKANASNNQMLAFFTHRDKRVHFYITRNMLDPVWHVQFVARNEYTEFTKREWRSPVLVRNKAALETILHAILKERFEHDDYVADVARWVFMQGRTEPPPPSLMVNSPDLHLFADSISDDIELSEGDPWQVIVRKTLKFVLDAAETLIATA